MQALKIRLEKFVIPLPKWLKNMPDGPAKNAELNRFYLRLACLYAHPSNRIYEFAKLIGINYATLKSQVCCIVPASDSTKEGIRQLLGDAFTPPDVWLAPRSQRNQLL